MIKALFVDFYGTVVHEDGEVIKQISQEIYDTGKVNDKSEIGSYWWGEFQNAFLNAYGDNFVTQRELEYMSLVKTIQHFNSSADAKTLSGLMFNHWIKPPILRNQNSSLNYVRFQSMLYPILTEMMCCKPSNTMI